MAKTKSVANRKASPNDKDQALLVIDEKAGLIFESEKAMTAHFQPGILALEAEYQSLRQDSDFSDADQMTLESHLEDTLDDPDEVWQDSKTLEDTVLHTFIANRGGFHYVAVAYVSTDDGEPTFVLTHFPTRIPETAEAYRRGELVYDKGMEKVQPAVLDGDALGDGDPLAIGLYLSMTKVRSDKDVLEADFIKFADLREDVIENPDEIWRKNDLDGNILVSFIKEFPDHDVKELNYVVVTQEDEQSGVHALLFSFPTTDQALVDRYRQGENLQAEEVVQENSH